MLTLTHLSPRLGRVLRYASCLPALLLLGSVPDPAVAAARRPVLVASIFPLAAIARDVAGPAWQVAALLTPGANPHSFEPTPAQVWAAGEARVAVRVGLGFDDWIVRVLEGIRRPPAMVVAGDGIDLLPLSEADEVHDHDEPWDPHVWMDPMIAARIGTRIGTALAAADPADAAGYAARAQRFEEAMRALDGELRARLEPYRDASFVGTHAAWAYFARRYGLRQLAVLERAPGRAPGPRYLLGVAEAARRDGARAVFAEVQLSQGEARVIAEEARIPVVLLDPLGGANLDGRATYADLLRWNAQRIADAFAGAGPR